MIAVTDVLPHREPFLFIDEVVEVSDDAVLARRTVRADEPQFRGHYPGKPIMPGVLLCETVLQAGCVLISRKLGQIQRGMVPVVTRMNNVKFKRMVKPGDVLEIRAKYDRAMLGAHMMSGSITVDGKTVVSLDFACMLTEEAP
jgi:3-hydroxyacyl-[acyl-carrier-protein] dehydratase